MGRLSEAVALVNMTSDERKKYAYGQNKLIYFSHLNIDDGFLKKYKPPRK